MKKHFCDGCGVELPAGVEDGDIAVTHGDFNSFGDLDKFKDEPEIRITPRPGMELCAECVMKIIEEGDWER